MEPGRALRDAGWAALLVLFAASLLTVLGWLLQSARGWWRRGAPGDRSPGPAPAAEPAGSLRELGVWRSLLRLRAAPAGAPGEPGVRGLLASLFAFKSFRENWQRAWVRALNEQACRAGVSVTGHPGAPSLSLSFPGRDRSLPGGPDGGGDQRGSPWPLFLFGVREKGAGEAGGGRKPAGSPVQCSCGRDTLAPTPVQTAVLIATLTLSPRALPPSECADGVGVRGVGGAARVGGRQVILLTRNLPGSPAPTPS